MKDAFWTAGNREYAPYEFARRAIAAKTEDEKPQPPPLPPAPPVVMYKYLTLLY